MGYVNYFLDDGDIIDQRITRDFEYNTRKTLQKKKCPYCNDVFENAYGLHEHIKNKHNDGKPILFVNGKIPDKNGDYYVDKVDLVEIYFYGSVCDVCIEDMSVTNDDKDRLDVTSTVHDLIEQNNICRISIGNEYVVIRKFSLDAINDDKVNMIIRGWEKKIISGGQIDRNYLVDLNPAELKYLDGFFDYFTACNANIYDKGKRYLDAYTILSSFNPINSIGLVVLKTIAFRLNWVSKLMDLCEYNDDFMLACNFYNGNHYVENIVECRNGEGTIYIEDDILDCLNAVVNYAKYMPDEVDGYIANCGDYDSIADVNLKDRVLLLMARRSIDRDNMKLAKYYYEEIKCEYFQNDIDRYIRK